MTLSPKSRIALILLLVLAICAGLWYRGRYAYPITNREASGDVIIAFGDSLTYGTGAERGEAWPAVVSRECGHEIINKGVPGDTTADALRRLDRDVLSLQPRMVIVGLGGNDTLQQMSREQLFGNLRQIVTEIQASGAMTVLVGLNGFPLDRGLSSEYRRVARETGSVYIPNILGGILTNAKLKADQIHPNAAGYKIMADRICEAIKPHL